MHRTALFLMVLIASGCTTNDYIAYRQVTVVAEPQVVPVIPVVPVAVAPIIQPVIINDPLDVTSTAFDLY